MGNSIKILDYNGKNSFSAHKLIEPLCEYGLNYYNEHFYGIGCYEPVYVYYFGIDTPKNLHRASNVVKKAGFTPLLYEDRELQEYDPYEIIMSQPITRKYAKEIKADKRYYEELRREEQRHYEEKEKIRRRRDRGSK